MKIVKEYRERADNAVDLAKIVSSDEQRVRQSANVIGVWPLGTGRDHRRVLLPKVRASSNDSAPVARIVPLVGMVVVVCGSDVWGRRHRAVDTAPVTDERQFDCNRMAIPDTTKMTSHTQPKVKRSRRFVRRCSSGLSCTWHSQVAMLLNMRGGWAGDPGDQRMPSALELWIFPDELDPIYAESLGLMADQIARSRLVIRKNEERLKRPRSMHHVFAIDEVELHSDLRQKRPALFETTGSNPLHRGPPRGTLFLAWSTLARVI